ncbi:MAG: T9SS type A sorting domain-containing protein [Bacteroidia bacterium]|jgi:hypothetical protein|nr:T9SS type A sorting domain-containing protein [Bacteroidia bacterium]
MKRAVYIVIGLLSLCSSAYAQFYNHDWFIGYGNWTNKGRIVFDSTSYIFSVEQRKMGFIGTQGNICDAQGNFLMSSNGVWIANANNDTMLNGSGLNPGAYTSANSNGLLIPHANVFLPFPGDSNRYVLFHHTAQNNGLYNIVYEVLYSVIDVTLDAGLGAVIQKNQLAFTDTLNWGITACKHANGRDWWIVLQKDLTDIVFIVLFSPTGVQSISSQSLGVPIAWGNVTQPTFSPDGTKFGYTTYTPNQPDSCYAMVFDFDRCLGQFNNSRTFLLDKGILWGLSFSPNSKQLYCNSSSHLFQIELDSGTIDTVAIYDGFSFPIPSAATTFMHEYLAANGKIYLTSGNGVQHLHEINYPDSAGLACDVQQHAVSLGVWHFRAVPNHPNYNLGPEVGSVCDTLSVGLSEPAHDFRFSISPNPVSDGVVKLTYLLPQNKAGVLEVFDLTGQRVFNQQLPPWSTLQFVQLPELSSGLYTCVIRSGNEKTAKKLVVMR